MRIQDRESHVAVYTMGVLTLFLMTFYTADLTHISANCHLQKFFDDSFDDSDLMTAIVGPITDV